MANPKGKIACFGLGEKGVNLVKSPLHLDDGELTSAQNAEFFRNRGRGGIRKRSGLARFNASALGVIYRFLNIPLPATVTTTILAAVEGTGVETWVISTNGTSWAEATAPVRPSRATKHVGVNFTGVARKIASLDGRIYYPADDFTQYPAANHQAPPIRFYDGSSQGEVCQVPNNPSVGDTTNAYNVECMQTLNGTIYLTTYDGLSAGAQQCGRVFNLDVRTGTLNQIGPSFGDGAGDTNPGDVSLRPFSIGWALGRLWLGMMNDSGSLVAAKIYSIRPGIDAAWTLEATLAANEPIVVSFAEYRGQMYAGCGAGALIGPRIYVRAAASGAWAQSDQTAKVNSTYGFYVGLVVYNDELYAGYFETGAKFIIRKLSAPGGAWATDRDLNTLLGLFGSVGDSIVVGSAVYYVVMSGSGSYGVVRKNAGAWAAVADFVTVIGSANGVIGYTVL